MVEGKCNFVIGNIGVEFQLQGLEGASIWSSIYRRFISFENVRPLCICSYRWIQDESFCVDKIWEKRFEKERNIWLGQEETLSGCRFYSFIKNSVWTVFYDSKNDLAVGVSPLTYCLDAFKSALSLVYLKATTIAPFFSLNIHAACIVVRDKCFVFPAESGGGKTTLSLNAIRDGMLVLSDDSVIIGEEGGVFRAYGTPFGEICGYPDSYPISGVVLLKKSDVNSISHVSSKKIFSEIFLRESFYRVRYLLQDYSCKLFSQFSRLLDRVPLLLLEFRKDFCDWEMLYDSV